jgi:hypothetical protein
MAAEQLTTPFLPEDKQPFSDLLKISWAYSDTKGGFL